MYALAAHLYAFVTLLLHFRRDELLSLFLVIFLSVSAGCSIAEYGVVRPFRYRVILAIHAVALIFGQYYLSGNMLAEVALIGGVLAGVAIYERFPINVLISLLLLVILSATRLSIIPSQDGSRIFIESLGIPLLYLLISALACALIYYREKLIETQIYGNRLDQAIGKLTRANQEYQDYLIKVEAESTERERKRITRDIHDVVGYTLTNNIMLMEAATDMMRSNPIGVTKLLNTARENAQEGLSQVREALYSFRLRKDHAPHGLQAVAKLVITFRLATGIQVETEYGNMPWTVNEEIDSTVYPGRQEWYSPDRSFCGGSLAPA